MNGKKLILSVVILSGALAGCGSGSSSSSNPPPQLVTTIPFNGTNGSYPSASPVFSAANNLYYGTTYLGGKAGYGSIYSFSPSNFQINTILDFDVFNGLTPSQGPALSADGKILYGSTSQGGANGNGIIWAYDTTTNKITTLCDFNGANGSTPQGSPIVVGNTIYGVAGQGGAYGYGTLYSCPTSGGTLTALYSFNVKAGDAGGPFGSLAYESYNNSLYGVGFIGGANNVGGVFSYDLSNSAMKLETSFDMSTTGGLAQMGTVIKSPVSNMLYVNTWLGAANNGGALLAFNPETNTLSVVSDFNLQNGESPYNSPTISADGSTAYIAMWKGSQYGTGSLVAIDIATGQQTVITPFTPTMGIATFASPTLSPDNKTIYLAISAGGANQIGTLNMISNQ